MANYRFTDWFELGSYYSVHHDNIGDRDGDERYASGIKERAYLKDFALSLRFDINDNWIAKIEGHFMDGLLDVNYGDDPDPDSNWQLYAAKMSYSF